MYNRHADNPLKEGGYHRLWYFTKPNILPMRCGTVEKDRRKTGSDRMERTDGHKVKGKEIRWKNGHQNSLNVRNI